MIIIFFPELQAIGNNEHALISVPTPDILGGCNYAGRKKLILTL